jgi:hypothetical protein
MIGLRRALMFRDLTGQKFGRLTAQWPAGLRGKHIRREVCWLCLCNCGNLKVIAMRSFVHGETKSCRKRWIQTRGLAMMPDVYPTEETEVNTAPEPSEPEDDESGEGYLEDAE